MNFIKKIHFNQKALKLERKLKNQELTFSLKAKIKMMNFRLLFKIYLKDIKILLSYKKKKTHNKIFKKINFCKIKINIHKYNKM